MGKEIIHGTFSCNHEGTIEKFIKNKDTKKRQRYCNRKFH